jgi:hypothetical protein
VRVNAAGNLEIFSRTNAPCSPTTTPGFSFLQLGLATRRRASLPPHKLHGWTTAVTATPAEPGDLPLGVRGGESGDRKGAARKGRPVFVVTSSWPWGPLVFGDAELAGFARGHEVEHPCGSDCP